MRIINYHFRGAAVAGQPLCRATPAAVAAGHHDSKPCQLNYFFASLLRAMREPQTFRQAASSLTTHRKKKPLLSRLAVNVGSLTSSLWAHSSFSLINYPPGWRGLGSLGAPPPSSQGCPSPEGRFFPPGSQPKAPFSHGGPQPRGAPPRHRGIRSGALPCDARAPRQLINYQHCPQLFLC